MAHQVPSEYYVKGGRESDSGSSNPPTLAPFGPLMTASKEQACVSRGSTRILRGKEEKKGGMMREAGVAAVPQPLIGHPPSGIRGLGRFRVCRVQWRSSWTTSLFHGFSVEPHFTSF